MSFRTLVVGLLVMGLFVPVLSHAGGRIVEQSISGQDAAAAPTPQPAPDVYASYDDDAIQTDRPRATRDLTTVGKRTFQVETSFAYEKDTAGAVKTTQYSFPTKLRYGLVDRWEVHVQGNMATFRDSSASNASGFGDFFLGTKWAMLDGGGFLPSVGVIAELGLPTGSNNVSGNALQPRGGGILAWDLPWEFQFDANLGMDVPPKDAAGDRVVRLTYGTALARPLPVFGDRMTAFVELAGATPLTSGKSGTHQAGTGLGFRIKDNMQIDSFARLGLNKAAPNFQTGLGCSWRM